jgi:hypothetical protein
MELSDYLQVWPIYRQGNSSHSTLMRRMNDPRADNEAGGEEKILFSLLGFEYSGT